MTELDVSVHSSIDEVDRNQWNNMVGQSDRGSVFHRHEWLSVAERTLDRDPVHAVVTKGGNPVAVFPNFLTRIDAGALSERLDPVLDRVPLRRLVSIDPGYGGPVIVGNTEECLDLLFEAMDERTDDRTVYHSIRTNDTGSMRYAKYLTKRGFSPTLLSCRFVVDLEAEWSRIERGMHKTRRHGVRTGRERAVEVEPAPLAEVDVDRTYESYRRNMERVGGDPFPRSFLRALATDFADRTMAFTATADGQVLGRFVHLLDEERSSLLYYVSAIGDESSFEYNTSEVLHAEAMRWGMDNGIRTYDLGATGADFADGVFRYKEKYGGKLLPILNWRRRTSTLLWLGFRAGTRLYQKTTY